jgi:hypothetical protein
VCEEVEEVAVACLDEGEVALVGRGAVEGGLEVPEEVVAHQGPVVQRPVQQKPGQRRIVVALDCGRHHHACMVRGVV